MGDRAQSQPYDEDDLESWRHGAAVNALPRKLLETLVEMARTADAAEMLNATLQKTLDVSTELTKAEEGSIFLLDRKGQATHWILSQTEILPDLSPEELDRILEKGLAGWVKRHHRIELIADTQKDKRWLDLSGRSYAVRSALVIPIFKGKELLGILSLLHSQPDYFSQETADLMQVAADQIGLVLQNARLYTELNKQKKVLNQELEKGQYIQRNFLPSQIPQIPGWEVATFFQPAYLVAGDFYDIFELPNQQIGLTIADVCDKGVGAALFMALFRSLIRIFSGHTQLDGTNFRTEYPPILVDKLSLLPLPKESQAVAEKIAPHTPNPFHINALKAVRLANNYIALNHGELGMFATLFFGVLDPKTGLLSYINGGHDPLIVVKSQGGIGKFLHATGPAVGLLPNLKFRIRQTTLDTGEILLGYTDGVTEARTATGDFFTAARLLSLLEAAPSSAQALLSKIADRVLEHAGEASQFDDITLLAVRRESSTVNSEQG